MAERRFDGYVRYRGAHLAKRLFDFGYLIRREKPVRAEGQQEDPAGRRRERSFEAPFVYIQIELLDGLEECQEGVRVKALRESLSLVAKIALNIECPEVP